MKKYALLYVSMKTTDGAVAPQTVRSGFEDHLQRTIPLNAKDSKIANYAWLLDRKNDVSLLAAIVTAAELYNLRYSLLFLTED